MTYINSYVCKMTEQHVIPLNYNSNNIIFTVLIEKYCESELNFEENFSHPFDLIEKHILLMVDEISL